MISLKRSFSIVSVILKSADLNPVFKPHHANPKGTAKSFSKNLPQSKKQLKPWEKKNLSKDEFFMRKYGNITPEQRKALDEKVARQRRHREMRIAHEKALRDKEREERENARQMARMSKKSSPSSGSAGLLERNDTFFDYIFGTHAVKAALTAGKRRVLELYTYNNVDPEITKLAENKFGILPRMVRDKHALNVLCKNGVHNGVVLKTRKLDVPYLKELGRAEDGKYTLTIENSEDGTISEESKLVLRDAKKDETEEFYPLMLYLDEVTDPQNMGSVLRSAFFFGIDGVILPDHSTAKLGPIAFKASAGALDLIDLYQTESSLKFIDSVRKNGWHVISTSGKPDEVSNDELADKHPKTISQLASKFIDLEDLQIILRKSPVMLVIGSEGEGVRTNVKLRSDYLVGIPKYRSDDVIVDSLNVGVATGVILQNCIGK